MNAYLLDPLSPPGAPMWREVEDRGVPWLVPLPRPPVDYRMSTAYVYAASIEYIGCNPREYASPLLGWRGVIYAADHDAALARLRAGEATIELLCVLSGRACRVCGALPGLYHDVVRHVRFDQTKAIYAGGP